MPLSSPAAGSGGIYFSRFLDTAGDGTGTKNATGDFLASATDFKLTPGPGQQFQINRICIQIEDVGNINSGKYGNLPALTNGILLLVLNGLNIDTDLMDGIPVFTNGNWSRCCYDFSITEFGGGAMNYVNARWTFARGGAPVILPAGLSLAMRLNDNFAGLNSHTFCAQGLLYE